MTAINCLVDAAGGMDGQVLESMSAIQGAVLAVQALCESFLAALANVPTQDYFRAEFRLPTEPREFSEEQEPTQANVNVGVDVYAIAKQIQDAMGHMQKESISIPDVCSSLASSGSKIPAADTSISREISMGLAKEYSRELSGEITKEPAIEVREPRMVTAMPERSRPAAGSHWYRSRNRDTLARPPEKPAERAKLEAGKTESSSYRISLSENIEQHIQRSTMVISEMENVIKNVMSTETIRKEAVQPSSTIGQLQSARVDMSQGTGVQTPAVMQLADAQRVPFPEKEVPQERDTGSPLMPDMAEAIKPAFNLQKAAGDASTNARVLSESLARSASSPQGSALPEANAETPRQGESPAAYAARAMYTIIHSYNISGSRPGGAALAQSPIFKPAMHVAGSALPAGPGAVLSGDRHDTTPDSGETQMDYAGIALSVNRSIEALSNAGSGASIQSPVIRLVNSLTSPVAVSSPADAIGRAWIAPELTGHMPFTQARDPVISLAVSMASAHAAQQAGASAIREFVLASPSIAGGVQAPGMADRSVVSMPGVTVERETSSSVSRTSNFHNTFNINITMKGGEEGDMKELGKKIGRILSDEIKRYGGA